MILFIFAQYEMTIFYKRAINNINTRGARKFFLAEIIPFEPESLILMQESGNLITLVITLLKIYKL